MIEGPPKPAGPARVLRIGCGVAAVLLVSLAAIGGAVFWKLRKGMDELAMMGKQYLRSLPEARELFGEIREIEANPGSFNLQIRNHEGCARFQYRVRGQKASGEGQVDLVKSDGSWSPAGARLTSGSSTVVVGPPSPAGPR